MKHYLRLDELLGPGAELPFAASYVEVGEDGWVGREIGLDQHDRVVYKFPEKGPFAGFRGMCDMALFDTASVVDAISEQDFDRLWSSPLHQADQERSIRAIRGPSIRGRVLRLLRGHETPH